MNIIKYNLETEYLMNEQIFIYFQMKLVTSLNNNMFGEIYVFWREQ